MKNLVLPIVIILFSGCLVKQNLSISHKLSPGMSKYEVESIMGSPVKSDFDGNIEEWHYCRTGSTIDEYLALFFYEGKLLTKKNYSVGYGEGGTIGSCEKFIKRGNYKVPEEVLEIRLR